MNKDEQQAILHEWLNKHRGLLFKIVRSYAFTDADRDDLFQEITLQVWRSIPNFRGESAVTTWIYRIGFNTAIRWKAKEKKHQEGRQPMEMMPVLQVQPGGQDERLDWLYDRIAELPEVDRSICLLLLDDFSYKEMAKITGISESNVAVKIHRIKKHLKNQSKKLSVTNGI